MVKFNLAPAFLVAISFGLTLSFVPQNQMVKANEVTNTTQENTTQAPVKNNTQESNSQPANSNVERSPDERRDDRVYISEIYPEYCRSYFVRRDWVGLFEYREGMYRCLYGNDRSRGF